jgi:ABC-type uncharacterized transport system auxiliary subunit
VKARWILASALALATLLLATGCFMGKTTQTKYYLLDYIPTPPKERLDKGFYPFVLRVKDVAINETYRRTQIVYRQNAHQMQFYSYHLWAVDPERMVGELLVKHLRAARLFQNIIRSVEAYEPDFTLSAEIQAIEEYDYQEQWFAHLAIEYRLEHGKTGEVVWKKNYDLRRKVSQQEPVYVVRELSALLEAIHGMVVKELDVVLDEARYR